MTNRLLRKAGYPAALAAVLLIGACGDRNAADQPSPAPSSPSVTAPETQSPAPSESANKRLVDEFVQHASENMPADQLLSELGRSVAAASPADADEMLRAMDQYYTRNQPEMEKKFEAEKIQQELSKLNFRLPLNQEQINGIQDDETRKLASEALNGGYKLETSEGFVYPIVDYAKLQASAESASPAMKDYLSIMAAESEHKTMTDAAFAISRDELVKRIIQAENFAKQYPDSPEYAKVEQWFVQYLTLYLVGLDNTPNYDDSYHVLPEMKTHFQKTVSSHPGTVTAKLTAELLEVLGQTNGAFFNKADDGMQVDIPAMKMFRDGIEKRAKEGLKAS
ncbi:hypothetical protein E5161_14645 [Cohnella pontilimi]|uniref:Uncharacterized protein n=1 Tax=Cohnella pontilimi TaxID=2564100 RepID=A0A4U0F8J4_9BACL|nr:hypothetical protein [Cohnella pontilimi]TJY40951.1 hypothetical protein E5161_14645 [Cohnella pontilimi]